MHSFDVIGYTDEEGCIFCELCGDSGTMMPVFADNEFDSPQYCEKCGDDLGVNLIGGENQETVDEDWYERDEIGSVLIRAYLEKIGESLIQKIKTVGDGDNALTLWEVPGGYEIIETNGDPVFEGEDGFAELRAEFYAKGPVEESARRECPRCGGKMGKHHNPDKARKGYKICPDCNMTYSPEAMSSKGSWAAEEQERKDGLEEAMASMAYDDLAIIPSIVAKSVVEEPYTGYEYSNQGHFNVESLEAKRLAMTLEDRQRFIDYADKRCRDAYEAKADWFMKIIRSKTNAGRDQLYVWISHWLNAFLVDGNPQELQ